jgi:hypothetical protein
VDEQRLGDKPRGGMSVPTGGWIGIKPAGPVSSLGVRVSRVKRLKRNV